MQTSVAPCRMTSTREPRKSLSAFEKNTAQDTDTHRSMIPMPARTMTPFPLTTTRRLRTRDTHLTTVAACLMLALYGCASVAPQRAAPVAVDVPAAWSAERAVSDDRCTVAGAVVAALRRPAARQPRRPGPAGQHQRAERAGRAAAGARAARCGGGRAVADGRQFGLGAAQHVGRQRAPATASGPASTRAGSSTSSAPTAARWTRARPRPRASAASLGDVQVSIAAEVALGYITLRGAQARLAIASDNLASQLETLQITQWRLQAGLVTSLEAEQARAAAEQTRAQLPALQTSIEQTRHALAVLTGQPPAALADDAGRGRPGAAGGRRPGAEHSRRDAAPAARRARRRTPGERPRWRAWRRPTRRALPSFKLGGSLGLSALTLGALTSGASVVSALLASVSLPIFDGGAAARPGARAAGRAGPGAARPTRPPC